VITFDQFRDHTNYGRALTITRRITSEECPWLKSASDKVFEIGDEVFFYYGPTFGVVNYSIGIPISQHLDRTPFHQLPFDCLAFYDDGEELGEDV
jgi:hypothetical protein